MRIINLKEIEKNEAVKKSTETTINYFAIGQMKIEEFQIEKIK